MAGLDYCFIDRLLHKLALQYTSIAQISFDIDQKCYRDNIANTVKGRHVFISGLARAGTTILMRRFYETGLYRSLTYRDMPFVLAPGLWRTVVANSKRNAELKERAHADNILVNVDSPESLEEVFWRVFAEDEYITDTYLVPHAPAKNIIKKYIQYVDAVLSSDGSATTRYLSKNNNNILRLGAIGNAFPNALILIPFRDPYQHANSLYRQHKHFCKLQEKNEFILSYMRWLAHHEFGLDHRPFNFGDFDGAYLKPDIFSYWLQLWCSTYDWLLENKSKSHLFVCYEDLCSRHDMWKRLSEMAGVPFAQECDGFFQLSKYKIDYSVDPQLSDKADQLYGRLMEESRSY